MDNLIEILAFVCTFPLISMNSHNNRLAVTHFILMSDLTHFTQNIHFALCFSYKHNVSSVQIKKQKLQKVTRKNYDIKGAWFSTFNLRRPLV